MSTLRILVIAASSVQVCLGFIAAYHLLYLEVPDVISLILCSAIIIIGLAGISALHVGPCQSISRRATIKLNVLLLSLILAAATVVVFCEQQQGLAASRLPLMITLFVAGAAPFLINSLALAVIERRAGEPLAARS